MQKGCNAVNVTYGILSCTLHLADFAQAEASCNALALHKPLHRKHTVCYVEDGSPEYHQFAQADYNQSERAITNSFMR